MVNNSVSAMYNATSSNASRTIPDIINVVVVATILQEAMLKDREEKGAEWRIDR